MTVPALLTDLVGRWQGANRLWLSPHQPAAVSDSPAVITTVARGRFMTIQYTWAYEGQPQEGLLLAGEAGQPAHLNAVWVDSWHMGDSFMLCRGEATPAPAASVAVEVVYRRQA